MVPSHTFVRDNPVIKRGIGESPEGKPLSKKQDIAASPLGPVLEGKDDSECRSDSLNCTVRYLGFVVMKRCITRRVSKVTGQRRLALRSLFRVPMYVL